jgi:hypothetical protein
LGRIKQCICCLSELGIFQSTGMYTGGSHTLILNLPLKSTQFLISFFALKFEVCNLSFEGLDLLISVSQFAPKFYSVFISSIRSGRCDLRLFNLNISVAFKLRLLQLTRVLLLANGAYRLFQGANCIFSRAQLSF